MSKAGAIDAKTNFSNVQVKDMEELLRINEELKTLETKKKKLVDSVKADMIAINATCVDVNGHSLTLSESTRRTVSSKTKDSFIAKLVSLGKKHLVTTEIKPDVDGIFAEVDAGTLDKDFVSQYIKSTPVFTLRCD